MVPVARSRWVSLSIGIQCARRSLPKVVASPLQAINPMLNYFFLSIPTTAGIKMQSRFGVERWISASHAISFHILLDGVSLGPLEEELSGGSTDLQG